MQTAALEAGQVAAPAAAATQPEAVSGVPAGVDEKSLSLAELVEETAPVARASRRSATRIATAPAVAALNRASAPPRYRLAALVVGKRHRLPPVQPFLVEALGLDLAPGSSAASLGRVLERASHHPQRLKSALTDQSVPFSQVVAAANRDAEAVPPWLAMTPRPAGARLVRGNRRALVQSLRLVDARNRESNVE